MHTRLDVLDVAIPQVHSKGLKLGIYEGMIPLI